MTHFKALQIKKPLVKALFMITALCLFWSFKTTLSLASSSFTSPIPGYHEPQIKGESANDNPDPGSFANLIYPLTGLVFGSGVISGVAVYKRKNRKNSEEINFVDPQTS